MTLHVVFSPGGSPGVTTSCLAMALAWPGPVILAECDPGGGDILAGRSPGGTGVTGLLAVAAEAVRGEEAAVAAIRGHLRPLGADDTRMLLEGTSDPRQAAALAWPALAPALASTGDVIADMGRFDGHGQCQAELLQRASTVTMVVRPTLRQVARAVHRARMLDELGLPGRRVLLVVGEGGCTAREMTRQLGADVAIPLPSDPRTARAVAGGDGRPRRLQSRPLMRKAAAAARMLCGMAASPVPGGPVSPGAMAG